MSPMARIPADPDAREGLARVVAHLADGGLLAYPTETVYGLGGAVRPDVIRRVREVKGRKAGSPFLVLIPSAETVGLTWTPEAKRLADAFWPGPLTLVLEDRDGSFPDGVRSEAGGVAVRVSPHPYLRALGRAWGRPLLSTSANRSGEFPASDPDRVERSLGGRPGSDRLWLVDGGPLPDSPPSTVVDCLRPTPVILRAGALPSAELRRVSTLEDRT